MGTNYYAKRIVTEDDIQKLHKLIDERKFTSDWTHEDDVYDSAQNLIADITSEGIHICKMSCGWQVSFDHNWGKYWQPNKKSLEDFLSNPAYEIVDEYGMKFTPDEFWAEVKEHNDNPDNSFTSHTYRVWERKNHPDWWQSTCDEDKRKCIEIFGIDPGYDTTDFAVDGLRFSVFSDFC